MLTDAPCVPAAFLCSSDSTYQACVAACEPPESCQDGMLGPLDPEQCQVLGEGCVCSEGTILHRRHSALCIPEEKCGRFLPSRGGTLQAGFALGPPAPSCTRGLYPSGSALGWSLSQGGSNLGQSGSPHSPESPMPPTLPLQPARTARGCRGPWGRPGTAPSADAANTSAKLRTPSSQWTWTARAPALRPVPALGRWPCSGPRRIRAAWGLFVVSPTVHFPGP